MMSEGIDLTRLGAPEHARAIDSFKDQLLIALVRRQADSKGELTISAVEVDTTEHVMLKMEANPKLGEFKFIIEHKH